MVNEAMARKYWPGRDPIGERIWFDSFEPKEHWLTIVGVVGDVRQSGLTEPVQAQAYVCYSQVQVKGQLGSGNLMVRSAVDLGSLAPAVRRIVRDGNPEAAATFRTMDDVMADATARQRFQMQVLAAFAVLALVLAAVGLYGVLAYGVTSNRAAIGIRMALGAQPPQLFRMVAWRALWLTSAGAAIGLAACLMLRSVLAKVVFGVGPSDPRVLAAAVSRDAGRGPVGVLVSGAPRHAGGSGAGAARRVNSRRRERGIPLRSAEHHNHIMRYDAILIVSFGGPERTEDVIPFLENVLRGRNVPRERMLEVAEHYYHFNGSQPHQPAVPRPDRRATRTRLAPHLLGQSQLAPDAGRYGARRWPPMGCGAPWQSPLRRTPPTPAAGSTSRTSRPPVPRRGPTAPVIDKLPPFWQHEGFVAANSERVAAALALIPAERRSAARLIYTAHSIPVSMARVAGMRSNWWRSRAVCPNASPTQNGISSGKAAAVRPPSPGWNPTFSTTFARWPKTACATWLSLLSASSAITWK